MRWGTLPEIGSMFHWETDFPSPRWSWPEPAVYYSICRHAIFSLCAAQPSRPVLWLPSFFCPEVARACRQVATVREYRDDCRSPVPDWTSLQPNPHDLVLAVNYFGVRSPEPWQEWRAEHECILVEDHTQDPFSSWALNSQAEYAVCSIRKTVPVPDGAIVWSPVGRRLPSPSEECDWKGPLLKAGAMLYKRDFLLGSLPPDVKSRFREMQLEAEALMGKSNCSRISPVAEALVMGGVPKCWRQQRVQNACTLLALLADWNHAEPIYRTWPATHAPFTFPLVFESQACRDFYQICLQRQDVYCPVEWVCDTSDVKANELSSRILSIPIDHRYGDEDMKRIATVIKSIDPAPLGQAQQSREERNVIEHLYS
jgi:hypothetical protein